MLGVFKERNRATQASKDRHRTWKIRIRWLLGATGHKTKKAKIQTRTCSPVVLFKKADSLLPSQPTKHFHRQIDKAHV